MNSRQKRRRRRIPRQPSREPALAQSPRAAEFRSAASVVRLTYTRRQAAEALGVSITTIDRRVVPALDTVKTPWGQRLIPVEQLERFVDEHLKPGVEHRASRSPGRPPELPQAIVDRIRLEHVSGRTFGEIARSLTSDAVQTPHGGQRWWPSSVRAILLRSERLT